MTEQTKYQSVNTPSEAMSFVQQLDDVSLNACLETLKRCAFYLTALGAQRTQDGYKKSARRALDDLESIKMSIELVEKIANKDYTPNGK